jgi:hypothetical protein
MGIRNMTIKDFSSKLDKVFLAFKEAKDNKKDNKVYKEQLEKFVEQFKELEAKLIEKQKNNFMDEEHENYYKFMKKLYEESFFMLENCQDLKNQSILLDIVIKSKEQKEKTYALVANTYSQFIQMINNLKQQIAQELNVVNAILTQKKS